jgi:hypothetical protein
MTEVPVARARFDGFDEDERAVLHFALQQVAAKIMDKAAADDYVKDDLAAAAGTFHLASTLAAEVGVTVGFSPPDPKSLQLVTIGIAQGIAPVAHAIGAGEGE